MFRAAHDFKVQIRVGEFLHFKMGEEIPDHLMQGPYAQYIMEHVSEQKPKVIVPEHVQKAQEVLQKAEAKKVEVAQKVAAHHVEHKPRHTIEPTSKLTAHHKKPEHKE